MEAVARFLALPAREQGRTIEAALALLVVWLAFGLLAFPRALRVLGVIQGEAIAGRVAAAEADEVSRAIARAARHVPFRAQCLQQAFAALLLLRRRGLAATVRFGVAHGAGAQALEAHAWSCCGSLPVTGGQVAEGFVPITAFAA
jgi:hypothetical protein